MSENQNFKFVRDKIHTQRMVLLQGGTRSGKTRSYIDFIINYCKLYNGLEIDITRSTFTALRGTAYAEFVKALRDYNIEFKHNKSEHFIELNGNVISFYGLDNDEKVHGRERDIIWINEINQIKETVFDQIAPRTRHRILGDYNPRLGRQHWLDPYIKKYPPLITTYLDNPFLSAAQVEDIESRKDNKYWWSIYGKGERAAVEGVIFSNWVKGEFNKYLPYCYAIDWGYYPDPLAMVKVAVDDRAKKIYVHELIYATEINDVAAAVDGLGISKKDLIVCDTNEPRAREALKKKGYNIANSEKKRIVDDIRAISNYQIVVTPSSLNAQMELDNYSWNDKRASIPIDDYNHICDGIRYCFNRLTSKSIISGAVYGTNTF